MIEDSNSTKEGDTPVRFGQEERVRHTGEGLIRSEGALADDPYWDDIMGEIHEDRKLERRDQFQGRQDCS